MKLLHLDSSILGRGSVTRELSRRIVERLVAEAPDASVTYRDLAADPLPHVTPVSIPSPHRVAAAADTLDEAGAADRATSDRVLAEFLDADTVVIGAPMYNFTLPSQLKAWIDRILIPGTTFRYGPGGVEGLAAGKRVVVGIARGGFYGPETGFASAEHAEAYLRSAFGFIGIAPEFVVAEGLSRGEDARADILASAQDAIGQLAA